jgi:hypothetical protein
VGEELAAANVAYDEWVERMNDPLVEATHYLAFLAGWRAHTDYEENQSLDPRELGCLCQECGQRFRGNLLVPNSVWEQIKPEGAPEGGGLLCPNCIMNRALDMGIWTAALATAPAGESELEG